MGTSLRKKSIEYSSDEYNKIFDTNLRSAFHLSQLCFPLLLRNKKANQETTSVVNIGSVAGSTVIQTGVLYAMTKAAMDHLTRYLACEWGSSNIRVNCVAPWYTDTPLAKPVVKDRRKSAAVKRATPLDRIANPRDVSGLVAFLCLPISSYITGQVISVDGGFTCKSGFQFM